MEVLTPFCCKTFDHFLESFSETLFIPMLWQDRPEVTYDCAGMFRQYTTAWSGCIIIPGFGEEKVGVAVNKFWRCRVIDGVSFQ